MSWRTVETALPKTRGLEILETMFTGRFFSRHASICLALLCVLTVSGCKSTDGPASGSLASVEIHGHTPLEIARAVSETFKAAGFEAIPLPRNDDYRMQFEKQGNTGSAILYSDWSFKPIWYRARVKFISSSDNSYVVTCNAFRVLERGDAHFEEEHKLKSKGPYQDLLDQAKAKLSAPQ